MCGRGARRFARQGERGCLVGPRSDGDRCSDERTDWDSAGDDGGASERAGMRRGSDVDAVGDGEGR